MQIKKKITIVSDIVCPWCVIGYLRLKEAITELGVEDLVDIEFAPFALNPGLPIEGMVTADNLHRKYGMGKEDAKDFYYQLKDLASELGFDFNITADSQTYSTDKAHILLELAKTVGKMVELKEQLFIAYCTENKNITDSLILSDAAYKVGISEEQVQDALIDQQLIKKVNREKEYWRKKGVTAVPTFFTDGKLSMSGCHSVTEFSKMLSS